MSKLKENIVISLIFFIAFSVGMTAFEFWIYDKIDIQKNLIGGGILAFLILLDRKYKFLDKIKKKLTFIK
jgi:glycopeptide antibiotics resistance protein